MQKNIPTKKSLPEMQQEFERIKNLEIRSRLKELPRLYGDIVRSYHEDTSIQELKFFMHVLKYMIKFEFRSPNQKKRFFSKLYLY